MLALNALAQDRQWFMVNTYHLNSPESAALFDRSFGEAVVSAMKRQGIAPVGIFEPVTLEKDKDKEKDETIRRYVVFPLDSMDQLSTAHAQLPLDADFETKAADYLTIDKKNAVYSRIESSLLYGFEGMPKLVVPNKSTEATRIFELRVYESHSKLKVEMFNKGEIEIFKEAGLEAVFFGEAMAGKNLPNLTYMLVYNDEAHRGQVWKKFLSHPKWSEMKKMERYKDTVSKIISVHMKPLSYSGIQ